MANAFYCGMACQDQPSRGGPVAELRSRSDLAGAGIGTAGGSSGSRNVPRSTACNHTSCQGRLGSGICLRAATSSTTALECILISFLRSIGSGILDAAVFTSRQ